ncbi:hypothetical protein [Streptomyces sp. NBC_00887]|uniref:hypothetical protein n=1 Tax=Streptomyces sp. NBC_00887 TaxID=2975859 RepID=UPI00386B2B97|nr:hypothetical protein OG844_00150 [Streptomyces sp. NBC_00887]WSY36381.1 hypothetical protein OG844_45445 [Streptomyces sp. NBC_00887]
MAVDELSLSLLGWQIDGIEARLVTTTFGKKEHFQEIAVSGTARFLGEDWSDRFGAGDYAPTLLLALSRTGSPAAPSYQRVVVETVKKVSKRPQRFSEKSDSWECKKPLLPNEITLRVTALDVEEIDSGFVLPPKKSSALPVEVIDETTHKSVRLRVASSDAHILRTEYDSGLRVHMAGSAEFSTANALLADHLTSDDWYDQDATLEDTCPFEVALPGLVVEVLDEGGFLLQKKEINLFGHVPVGESGKLPGRQPRWIADAGDDLDEYAGQPARVIVRIMDAEDL